MSEVSRRDFLKLSAVGAGALTLSQTLAQQAASATTLPPQCLWGAFPDPVAFGETDYMPAVYAFERLIGRPIGMTRHYLRWDWNIPNDTMRESARTGHIPYFDWEPHHFNPPVGDGTWIPWSDIAGGQYDEVLSAKATSLRKWNRKAFFAFHHEPEPNSKNNPELGTSADFKAAAEHVKAVFDSVGVPKIRFVCTLTRTTYDGGNGGPDAWQPSGYHLIGVDSYNRGGCSTDKSWKPFSKLSGARDYARSKGKKMIVGEFGCVETDACGGVVTSDTKAQWFTDAGATIKSWPEVKAVVYTHKKASYKGQAVDFRVNTTPEALQAYKDVGNDPYFNPQPA